MSTLNNNSEPRAAILSTGSFLPISSFDNKDLTQFPKNARELIEIKTGIKSRRYASEYECTSDLAIRAVDICLKKIRFDPREIDSIILTTSTPDRIQPATATRVQHAVGASNAFAFDLNSVCSGAVYSICMADSLIRSGTCNTVLVIASEVYSRFLNPKDFSSTPYFGDGAGAVLLGRSNTGRGVIKSILKTDGSGSDVIEIPAGGTMLPLNKIKSSKDMFFRMDGKKVYSFAVEKGSEIINELISTTGIDRGEISYIIPHQANINVILKIAEIVKINFGKFHINLDKYGNTASASVLIGLDEVISSAKLNIGDLLLLVGFGGGLSWGANLISI